MRRTTNFRTRLILFVVIASIPSLAIFGYSFFVQRNKAIDIAKEDALRLTEIVAQSHAQVVRQVNELLFSLSDNPIINEQNSEECEARLSSLLQMQADIVFLAAANLDGLIYCSSPASDDQVNVADRAYFQDALAEERFVVGEYIIGRITGIPVIAFAYPLHADDGDLSGVLIASISLDRFENLAREAMLPEGSTLTLIDDQGTILVRSPDSEKWVGEMEPNFPSIQAILLQGDASTIEGVGLDGETRLFGIKQLNPDEQNIPLYLSIGIPKAVAFESVSALTESAALGFFLLLAFMVMGGWHGSKFLILQPIEKIRQAADRIASGDLTARTQLPKGSGEIEQIAASFDKMASNLEQRKIERDKEKNARILGEVKFRKTLDVASDAIISIDEQQKITLFNNGAEKHFGYSSAEIIGQSVGVLLPQDLADRHQNHIRGFGKSAVESRKMGERVEILGKRKDGSTFPAEASISQLEANGEKTYTAILRDISERKQFEAEIERQIERLSALREIDLAITGAVDLNIVLNIILDEVCEKLEMDAASVLLLDPHTKLLEYRAGKGFRSKGVEASSVPLGRGYAGRVALDQKTRFIADLTVSNGDFFRGKLLEEEQFQSYYVLPLISKGRALGVLDIFHRSPIEKNDDWFSFAKALAGQTAIAIDNALLFDRLQRSNDELSVAYQSTLEGWSRALELRDDETQGHTQRVTALTVKLAKRMGIEGNQRLNLMRGALLHDIGKIGVPDSILLKAGPLDDEEWEIMKLHPVYAYDLIYPIEYLRPAIEIPYCHHEKWDGSGYPRGLMRGEIPLEARIFAVVDVWDALSSDRPYRKAWPNEKVLKHIQGGSSTHFDPDVVEIFFEMIANE